MGLLIPKICDQSRKIHLGQPNPNFCNNKVDTSKYNIITFLPKSLLLQFFRLSNVVFLINAILQSISFISSLSPFTAVGPLAFVLAISMLRQGYQDYKRHTKDWQINSRKTQVLKNGFFTQIVWDQIQVGDYIKICSGELIPADILLLYSSEQNSICYVETANLDGQNNLKEKHAFTDGIKLYPNQLEKLKGFCLVDPPKSNLYDFDAEIHLSNLQPSYIGYHNLILRETVLKNTDEVVGVALYCGYDTKILKNQGQVHHKVSRVQTKLNYIQVGLVLLLVILCCTCSIGYYVISTISGLRSSKSYIPSVTISLPLQSTVMFFTIFLLLNFLIPITLNILIEGIKMFSGLFLSFDRKMYDQETNKHCGILNTSIIEQLGVVEYILTDKTGTLTANEMVFKSIGIEDKVYQRKQIEENISFLRRDQKFQQFWISMIICHDVVRDRQKEQYQGSSPDEVCFIEFAHSIGYTFVKRTKNSIELKIHRQKLLFELLEVIPFSSRKRMSVIVRDIDKKQIVMYTKGADTSIFQKSKGYTFAHKFLFNLNNFAKKGLRTLVFSRRVISEQKLNWFVRKKNELKYQIRHKIITKEEGTSRQNQLVEQMEMDLQILGSTGIEDRLQQDVPQTISRLQRAGIKVMMITGDKLQTAKNIGILSQLIRQNRQQNYNVIELGSNVSNIQVLAKNIVQQLDRPECKFSFIIQGKQISKILEEQRKEYIDIYCKILQRAYSVIFCRSSPKQKALIVKFIKKHMNAVVLAIGDGGNDVGMIEQAHIGVGIIGKQGNSASVVSDFSFAKFKFLQRLVLHHGRWFYYRLSYFFVFFGWKNIMITLIIYFYQIDSAFSGSFNFTQVFYVLYNSFFGISLLVNLGLYDQDINDDLQLPIWNYLPEIYLQTKSKELFCYKRYIIWVGIGVFMALIMYFIIRQGISSLSAVDSDGMIPDLLSARIGNGIIIVLVLIFVNYLDTKTHTYFFQVFVALIMTILPTVAYFYSQNFMYFLGYFQVYTDNFNARFWLIIFLVIAVTFLAKIAIQCYFLQFDPTLRDTYLKAKAENVQDLEAVMQEAISNQQTIPRIYKIHDQAELCESKNEQRDSAHYCNTKDKSISQSILKRCNTSVDITTQGGPSKTFNFQSVVIDIERENFE